MPPDLLTADPDKRKISQSMPDPSVSTLPIDSTFESA
jgi:hypothetical protein